MGKGKVPKGILGISGAAASITGPGHPPWACCIMGQHSLAAQAVAPGGPGTGLHPLTVLQGTSCGPWQTPTHSNESRSCGARLPSLRFPRMLDFRVGPSTATRRSFLQRCSMAMGGQWQRGHRVPTRGSAFWSCENVTALHTPDWRAMACHAGLGELQAHVGIQESCWVNCDFANHR